MLFVVLSLATPLGAQISPHLDWRSIRTEHFSVHYPPGLEEHARRAAANAERAYAQLAKELHPPRGPIDLVVSDHVDFSNGYATAFPTNRIVVYASPPVSESALRFTDDWNQMVVTHEMVHVFHLDRARGLWALGQRVFGRSSMLFPNSNAPAWLTEGLAVYYESRLTGAGRLKGSEHRAIARAAAIDHRFPGLNAASLANPRFPFGEAAYVYGSLALAQLARTQPDRVGTFVEKSSAYLVSAPDFAARQAFGVTIGRAWNDFRRQLDSTIGDPAREPIIGWRDLTRDGVIVSNPRWWGDSAIVYSGTPGKETHGAYRVARDGSRERIGRRNSRTPNVLLPDGRVLFAQIDFTSPWEQRSDLYVQRDRGTSPLTWLGLRSRYSEERLTSGQRLFMPDARTSDGAIVAAQIVPGGTRLVRVSADGGVVRPITSGGLDEQWTEPRWSHAGDRIAAVRWRRGGISEIVVLDSTGRETSVYASGHSVQATPSWTADDSGILYSSDRSGEAQVYLQRLDSESAERRVSSAVTGMFEPQLSRDSALAAVILRGDGYHLGTAPCCRAGTTELSLPPLATSVAVVPPVERVTTPSRPYSPWRTLWPRWWLPAGEQGLLDDEYRVGLTTSGSDVIGRHSYDAEVLVPTKNSGVVGSLVYRYAGLGMPLLDLSLRQNWGWYARNIDFGDPVVTGEIRRRTQSSDLLATWVRQRVRTALSFSAGAGVERHVYAVLPAELLPRLADPSRFDGAYFPRLLLGLSWSNAQRPPFSVSPEDGLTFTVTGRERLKSGFDAKGPPSFSVVGVGTAYKSVDLFGFAHHVLALRGAGGWADLRSNGYFDVGGVSGTPIDVAFGYTIGEGRRTFPVRGFPGGTFWGVRAVSGTAAWRVPLAQLGRGASGLPVYFAQSSLELFADAASAWCPSVAAGRQVCIDPSETGASRRTIASAGAELNLVAAVMSWDDPYRFRLGVGVPVKNPVGARAATVYFAAGLPF